MATTFKMLAPNAAANAEFIAKSGNTYITNSLGYLNGVVAIDIVDLLGQGCTMVGTGLPWAAGRTYGVPSGVTPVSLLTLLGSLYAYPVNVGSSADLNALSVSVITGQTGGKARAGLYADNGTGYPGALIAGTDTGDLAATTTAVVGSSGLTITIPPAPIWCVSEFTATSTMPSVAGSTVAYTNELNRQVGFDTAAHALATSAQAGGGLVLTGQTYGALPTTFPTGAVPNLNAGIPLLGLSV